MSPAHFKCRWGSVSKYGTKALCFTMLGSTREDRNFQVLLCGQENEARLITVYSRETLYTLILGQKYDHLKALSGEHIKCKMCSVFSCGYW